MNRNNQIKKYSEYCLNCKIKPCSEKGCPLSNDIPTFINLVKQDKLEEAYKVLTNTTMLGGVCGRICPHLKQCQGSCVRGIKGEPVNIGEIEAFVFDNAIENEYYKKLEIKDTLKNKRIAVIGGGPAGLNAATFLRRAGADVTIYEKYHKLGGILRHGIPEYRLEKHILDNTIKQILELGINVKYGKELGKNIQIDELKEQYDSIFISIGANIPTKMNIPGEELDGVYGGNTLLENNSHPDYTGKKVAVIGGGNVAMDCSRIIKSMGAEKVTIIYRRAEEQMPAEKKEIEDAKKEGVEFLFQNNIINILGKNKVEQIECIKTELVKKGGETRLVPVEIPNSNYIIDIDYVVMALGSRTDKDVLNKIGLNLDEKGYIKIDENYKTSDPKIYAGGDLIGKKATVAWAAYFGREAAKNIINCLKEDVF